MSVTWDCNLACEEMPKCKVCRMTKRPRGRSVPTEAENGYCGYDCAGFMEAPQSGHLWPGELERAREDERDALFIASDDEYRTGRRNTGKEPLK